LYSRTLIVLHAQWQNVTIGQFVRRGPQTEPLVTLMVDLDQGFWIARRNWQLARGSFLRAVTGTANVEIDDVLLHHGSPIGPVRLTEYFMNGPPAGKESRCAATIP